MVAPIQNNTTTSGPVGAFFDNALTQVKTLANKAGTNVQASLEKNFPATPLLPLQAGESKAHQLLRSEAANSLAQANPASGQFLATGKFGAGAGLAKGTKGLLGKLADKVLPSRQLLRPGRAAVAITDFEQAFRQATTPPLLKDIKAGKVPFTRGAEKQLNAEVKSLNQHVKSYAKWENAVAATGKKLDAANPFLNPVYGNLETNSRHLQTFLKNNKVAPSDMLTVVEAGLKRGSSGLYNYVHPNNPNITIPATNKAHIQTGVKYKVVPQSVKEMRSDNKMYNQTRAENALRREESASLGKVVKTTATVVGSAAVGYGAAKLQEK